MRIRPYTNEEIKKVPCAHCGKPSVHQWQICAVDNKYSGVCKICDLTINLMVGTFMNVPSKHLKRYAKKLGF